MPSSDLSSNFLCNSVVDPSIKLDWYQEYMPEHVEWIKQQFINNICDKI